jgi:hypothetical protein
MSNVIITFKNRALIAWLESKGIRGDLRSYVSHPDVVHKHIIGHLPLWLAAYAESISEISLPRLTKDERQRLNDGLLSVADMDAGGAHLVTYNVRRTPFHLAEAPQRAA